MKVPQIIGIESWSQKKQRASKQLGSLCWLTGSIIAMAYFGVLPGLFVFSVTWMTMASLVILLMPLGFLNKVTLSILFTLSIILEIVL